MNRLLWLLFIPLVSLSVFADDFDYVQPTAPPLSAYQGGLGVNGTVYAIAMQPDGKVIIGGHFTTVNGIPRTNLARLNVDGTLDRTIFDAENSGTNGPVYALAIQIHEGQQQGILVGGIFNMAGNAPLMDFARFNVDGTPDKNFNGGKGPNGRVQAIAIQPDGKIVIVGEFSEVGPFPRNNIARFNTDSTLDGPVTSARQQVIGPVKAVAVNSDEIIGGGNFVVNGTPTKSIIQLPSTPPLPQ